MPILNLAVCDKCGKNETLAVVNNLFGAPPTYELPINWTEIFIKGGSRICLCGKCAALLDELIRKWEKEGKETNNAK